MNFLAPQKKIQNFQNPFCPPHLFLRSPYQKLQQISTQARILARKDEIIWNMKN